MKAGMLVFACVALTALVGVSVWATNHIGVIPAIQELLDNPTAVYNPWFIAALTECFFRLSLFSTVAVEHELRRAGAPG